MALYYDAVTVLTGDEQQGSLKSRIYSNKGSLKSKPAHLYALISECAKYDTFLKEVIDSSGFLEHERKVSPLLSLLLLHDHFFAKGGIAASAQHPLRLAVERHKARLQAEFTKARLKHRCGTVEDLKKAISSSKNELLSDSSPQPRWVRINRLKCTPEECTRIVFPDYRRVNKIAAFTEKAVGDRILHEDEHIPDLVAVPQDPSLIKSEAYLTGKLILQDKASCFPAYLLLGEADQEIGDILDTCAAPGNKTTHLNGIVSTSPGVSTADAPRIFACERDGRRSDILQSMVSKAGADRVEVLAKQDFLALDPEDQRFAEVTHLLLDPSCSGSGILAREDIPRLSLPRDPRQKTTVEKDGQKSKKRKRDEPATEDETPEEEQSGATTRKDPDRLAKLAGLQSRIIEHAFSFPTARRIAYSTCSVHEEENEAVVSRVLASEVAKARGWRVVGRHAQPSGMRKWPHRGLKLSQILQEEGMVLTEDDLEGCIRCYPNDQHGTMGFFVVAFERDTDLRKDPKHDAPDQIGEEEWIGFED